MGRTGHLAHVSENQENIDVPELRATLERVRERGYGLNYRADNVIQWLRRCATATTSQWPPSTRWGPAARMQPRDHLWVARQLHAAAAQLEDVLRNAPPG
jgi:hypothetical protein